MLFVAITPPPSLQSDSKSAQSMMTTAIILAVVCAITLLLCILFKKKHHPVLAIICTMVSVGCLIGSIVFFSDMPKKRTAKNSDVTISLSQDFNLDNEYEVYTKYDIDNLEITFTYFDSQNRIITTKTHSLGNVKKESTYLVTISLSEFSLSQLLRITSCRAEVTNGSTWN